MIRKSKRFSKNKKMLREYIGIVIFIGIVLFISFVVTEYIATTTTIAQSRQSSKVIYQQAKQQMMQVEEDIQNLRINVMSNNSALFFMKGNFAARWEMLAGVKQMVGNNRRINRNLENIILYNDNGNLIFSQGEIFISKADLVQTETVKLTYSGLIWDETQGKPFFEVGMPVLIKAENGKYQNIGSAYLLFNLNNLQDIVNRALLNEDSTIALLDKDGNYIVKAGNWSSYYSTLKSGVEDESLLIYADKIGNTGWRLVNVIPKKALLSGVMWMSKITYLTYISVIIAMSLLCVMIYKRVIKPITSQTAFMVDYVQNPKQRIKVLSDNEIGVMAHKMNQMLDNIEVLNQEIIESKKKYLEMEYAKKQTEMIAYRSQINPHFLSNTFECIRGMALYNGEKEIAELTQSLSRLFRYNIKGEELVSIWEELKNLQEYDKIIQYRFCGKHQVIVTAHRDIFLKKIPKMILQPLVENAVLHGLENKIEGGRVDVNIQEESSTLVIRVNDNGNGISPGKLIEMKESMTAYDEKGTIPDKQQGIGFLNVYRRLRLFYGDKAQFLFESCQEGTQITIILPLK